MKRIILILVFTFGLFINAFSQVDLNDSTQSAQELYNFHIEKKKANNLAGWLTLGGGIGMFVGGLAINVDQGFLGSANDNNKGLWLSYLGGASVLTSIPLFIAAGKHKRKAKIQLQNGAVGFTNEFNYSGVSISFIF